MANTEISKDISKKHPSYNDIAAKAQYWKDCFEASANLLSKTYIYQHLFESKGAYNTRLKRAFTVPFMRKPFAQFLAVMYGRNPVRNGSALSNIVPFLKDATGQEESWEAYMLTAAMYAMLFGKVYTVVDFLAPEATPDMPMTLADLDEGNVFPSVTTKTPLELVNWRYIPRKGFECCVFTQKKVIDGRLQDTLLYVDYDSFMETDKQGGKIKDGGPFPHNLGYTPVFTLSYNSGAGIDASLGALLAPMQKGVTNLCSIVDEMSERQAFSQLCFPDDGTMSELEHRQSDIVASKIAAGELMPSAQVSAQDNVLRMLSDSAALTWPAGTGHPPQFISPNATELKNIWRSIKDVLTQGVMATGLTDHRGNVTPESAASIMRVFSASAAAHEERVLKTVVAYGGYGNIDDISVKYPQTPVVVDAAWLDTCDKIAACTWLDDKGKVEAITAIVAANLDQSSGDAISAILAGIIPPKVVAPIDGAGGGKPLTGALNEPSQNPPASAGPEAV